MKLLQLLPAFLLASCSLAPDAIVPRRIIPPDWRYNQATEAKLSENIQWDDFGSETLSQLISTALAHNKDIAAALARVAQAQATATIAGANLYPQVNASGSANNNYLTQSDKTSQSSASQGGLSIAYGLDLWQRNLNRRDSAELQKRATTYDWEALRLVVSSEIARLYSGILAFNARLEVAEKNLLNANDVLRITELRYKEGRISGLELAQQRTSVATTEASIAALQQQRALFFNQLALVTGVAPSQLDLPKGETLDHLQLNEIELAAPWQLLERRPDIAAAEARLRAANLDIGVARAALLPNISLNLSTVVNANPNTNLTSLGASFFAPIFQGGALSGEVDRTEAALSEQLARYESVLLTSFREVEDALGNKEATASRAASLLRASEEADRANRIARSRFDAGSIDFTTLLATQTALLQAQDSYLSSLQAQFAAHIDLMRALGGSL
jgi:NodT family efflux transporter outer membrane factor (OMF) lipoprotein